MSPTDINTQNIQGGNMFLNPDRAVAEAGIKEGMKVADFGCGSGFFSRGVARIVGTRGEVWAIDVERPMLTRLMTTARMEGLEKQIHISAGDVERRGGSNLPDASMDMVIASNILFSAHGKDGLVEEIWRVLKDSRAGSIAGGGNVLIIDWTDSFGGMGPDKAHIVQKKDALALFQKGGFTLIREIPAGAHHWGLIMSKKSPVAHKTHGRI